MSLIQEALLAAAVPAAGPSTVLLDARAAAQITVMTESRQTPLPHTDEL